MANLTTKLSAWFGGADPVRIEQSDLRKGATFGRMTKTQVMETVQVLAISEDEDGIPHVRYDSRLHRAGRTLDTEQRTLAVPSFLNRFEKLPTPSRGAGAPFGPGQARAS